MVASDFRPEMEIQPFRPSTMKNVQYNPYLWLNRLNFRILKAIWAEKHDGDISF